MSDVPVAPEPAPVEPVPVEPVPVEPAAAGYAPAPAPGIPVGPRSPLLMSAVAVVLVIAAIANIVLFNVSPGGPVEFVLAYGTGLTFLMTGIAIGIVAIVLSRGGNGAGYAKTTIDPLAITSVSLAGLTLIGWAALGGGYFLVRAATGLDFRFMEDVNGAFWVGIPWMGAIIFGLIAYRQGRGTSNVLSLLGIGVGVLLIIPTLASGIIYGLHLSP